MPMAVLCQKTVNIQCNEGLHLATGSGHYHFNFTENGFEKSLNEHQLSSYLFKFPGKYEIDVAETKDRKDTHEDCLHLQLPEKISLYVDSLQVRFIENSIRTSQPIRKNQNTEGIQLLIDVELTNGLGDIVRLNTHSIASAGIGSLIIASLDPRFYTLKEGKHTLVYHLKGISSEASYIQFDFLGPNGSVFPIALKNPIQN
jgi:hypothetical protein